MSKSLGGQKLAWMNRALALQFVLLALLMLGMPMLRVISEWIVPWSQWDTVYTAWSTVALVAIFPEMIGLRRV